MSKTETERYFLYDGTVVIDFYPKSHRYKLISVDGEEKNEWIPSPSAVNAKLDKSQFLIAWAVRCFKDKMEELMGEANNFTSDDLKSMLEVAKTAHTEKKESAATIGTEIHHYAEHGEFTENFMSLSEEEREKATAGVQAFIKWRSQHLPNIPEKEFLVYSKRHGYVGTADAIAMIGDDQYLIDYKTSKGIYSEHLYQVSAYLKAYEEEYNIKLAGAIIINFAKEDIYDKDGNLVKQAGQFNDVRLSRGDLVKAFKGFKGLLGVYHTDKEIKNLIQN